MMTIESRSSRQISENMKAFIILGVIGLAFLAASSPAVGAATNSMTAALQQGLFEEEANNNLEAAIRAYQTVINQFDRDRKLAATAVYRLGECYRKQGKTNDAVVHYTRIVTEFSDVGTLVTLSRQNLAGLGVGSLSSSQPGGTRLSPRSATEGVVIGVEEMEIKRIRALIQNSPDLINARAGGYTPLHTAARQGQLMVTRFLLENGALVNASVGSVQSRGGSGYTLEDEKATALHLAAKAGHLAEVQLLLQHKADVAATDWNGRTPLHSCTQKGFMSVAEALLKAGADPNAKTAEGATPLHEAAEEGYFAVAELLLANKADVNAETKDGRTALHRAAGQGHTAMATLFLENGAKVNARDKGGSTPLAAAVAAGQLEMAKLLLTNKADPNIPAQGKDALDYPLHTAIKMKSADMLALLLENGADVNAAETCGDQQTVYPLHLTVGTETPEIAALLLKHKANPNLQWRPLGETPLITAIKKPLPKAVELLLQYKADVSIPDSEGNTALHYSIGQNTVLALVLAAGANVNATNKLGETPLHWAASSGLTNAVAQLVKHGAKLDLQASQGFTPLHYAVAAGQDETVNLLLSNAANPNLKDDENRTPFLLAKAMDGSSGTVIVSFTGVSVAPGVTLYRNSRGAPRPINYQGKERAAIRDILKRHGALEVLPDLDQIKVGRTGKTDPRQIFKRGTNDWNQFTLLEALGVAYGFLDPLPKGSARTRATMETLASRAGSFPFPDLSPIEMFPDLSRIQIRRPSGSSDKWTVETVDVAGILKSADCSKDITLAWGDVIWIPEADHVLNETWNGFSLETLNAFNKCWTREIEVVVKGKSTKLTLGAEYKGAQIPPGGSTEVVTNARLWIRPVLQQSRLLLASSDLSRIKVTRTDSVTGAKKEYVLDCSEEKSAPDFWLRNGDVIEVPDRN